jgi:hypothetical protein
MSCAELTCELTRIRAKFYPAVLDKTFAVIDNTEIFAVSPTTVNCKYLNRVLNCERLLDNTTDERRTLSGHL